MELLKKLSETPGAPGREERVRSLIQKQIQPFVDELKVDELGNLIGIKYATVRTDEAPPRVMIACHMDEIAFYVRHIDKNGFLRVKELGGFDVRNLFARQVLIQGKKDIVGLMNPAGPPIHVATPEERKKLPKISDFYIDTGLPVEEVKKLIRPGDPVTLIQEFRTIGDHATGKCLDNRVACWVGIRLLEELSESPYDVHVAFTVQEEIGVRGAKACAYSINPDIGIAIDVTLALDVPSTPPEEVITRLGDGVAIKIMDGLSISDRGLVDAMIESAEDKNIPYQLELLPRGGTDAAGIQLSRGGVRVITLSVPCRYIHTVTETIHQGDLRACVDLLLEYLSPED